MCLTFGFLHLLMLYTLGVISKPSYVLHEKRTRVPSGWTLARSHDADQVLPLRIALRQSNMHILDMVLNDVSHPDSPSYGNHWTAAQVAKAFAPSRETIQTVHTWLLDSGIGGSRQRISSSRNWIEVNTTVEEAERILHTKYYIYALESGEQQVACSEYYLPEHVSSHVDLVTPSIHFDAVLKKRGDTSSPVRNVGPATGTAIKPKMGGGAHTVLEGLENCDQSITPVCLRALYGLFCEPRSHNNTFGIVEYTPQAYIQSDLDMFSKNFSQALVGKAPKLVSVDGGFAQTVQAGFDYNAESNLDLQYAMNLVNMRGAKQDVILYQVGDIPQGGSFNNLLDALDGSYCTLEGGDDYHIDGIYPDTLGFSNGYGGNDCGTTKPANVIASSYGYNEADLSPFYTARQCAEYAKLGLMGVTVLYSSGDNGVAGNSALCLNPDGSNSADGTIFNPSFPSSCPYVTSIGATQINPGSNVTAPESACEQVIFSGGGFSNQFPMPSYQQKAVYGYMHTFKPIYPPALWNSTGTSRGYPDISANGANYVVAVDGQFTPVSGTSASTPVVGAILTMINDARLSMGKKPIGFINPAIYSDMFAGAFNDITSGGNQGCGTAGFTAVPGWDPVTGLGTPSFPRLLARWLILP